jgi:hypothetical protein
MFFCTACSRAGEYYPWKNLKSEKRMGSADMGTGFSIAGGA